LFTANHLNKCFYAETYRSFTPGGINLWVYVADLRTNQIYGGFHSSTNIGFFTAVLKARECHSEAEWDELVKPYMEDRLIWAKSQNHSVDGLPAREQETGRNDT